jgi:uncharacterized protein (DUF697 family)
MISTTEKTRKEKAKRIIMDAEIASSLAAGSTAQVALTGVDLLFSIPIIANMIIELAKLFGQAVDKAVATRLVGDSVGVSFATTAPSRSIIGFIPILGNVVNAVITYRLVGSIGWTVYELLKNGVDISNISQEEAKAYMNRVVNHQI